MKWLFIGDPHFDNQTPSSRIDNYAEVSLTKLESLFELAKEEGAAFVITTGDFFDKYYVSFGYLNELMKILVKFKEADIQVMSLIGNHDLPYNSMQYFKNTPLSVLFGSGLVKHLDKVTEFDEFNLYAIDFTEADSIKKFQLRDDKPNVLIAHYATDETVPGESIKREDINNFDYAILGHDHMYYEPSISIKGGCLVLRPGSFTRRTKDKYNLKRDIIVYALQDWYDEDNKLMLEYKELKLPNVKPASEVFKNEVFVSNNSDVYNNSYNELFNEGYFEAVTNNIFEIIDVLPLTVSETSKKAVIDYLSSLGINNTQEEK